MIAAGPLSGVEMKQLSKQESPKESTQMQAAKLFIQNNCRKQKL